MKKSNTTYLKLLILPCLLSLLLPSLLFCSGSSMENEDIEVYERETPRDDEESYIDSFVFLGESTTSHMKNRGVLSGGKDTDKVWSTSSGTLCLDSSIDSVKLIIGDKEMTVSECASTLRPRRIMLCFGLNGAKRNASANGAYFKSCYKRLISTIKEASPDTEIYIQSCYPIAENMDSSSYGCSPSELNTIIDTINSYARELSSELGLVFVDTAHLLKNERGMLRTEYQSGDGYHLTADAYVRVIEYIKTLGKEGKL
ncbi:MAG: hypothetical protein J6Q78_04295 [Clostridia bacterium]|nr:hypothetical protein [Clostridia bacterium]